MSSSPEQSEPLDDEALNRLAIEDEANQGSLEGSPVKEAGSHIAGAFIGKSAFRPTHS